MKFGVLMCAFREESKIKAAIKQFSGLVDEIVVTCSEKSWLNNMQADDTAALAAKAGALVKLHEWPDEKDQKNYGMELLKDMDWVIISAPDMYMTKESIHNLKDFLEYGIAPEERAIGCSMKTYWRNLDTIVKPEWDFNTVAIRPDERFEWSSRLKNVTGFGRVPGVTVHHLSWVKTNIEMQTKLASYSHADEIVPNWYENIWLGWQDNYSNFHPTQPEDYHFTVKYPLPKEIRDLLDPKWIRRACK